MAINTKNFISDIFLNLCKKYKMKSIKIQTILDEAGISRQTFYNYYKDKNDLIQYTYRQYIFSEFEAGGEYNTYYERNLNYCRAIEKYRFFMKQAIQLGGQNNLRDYILEYAIQYNYKWHTRHIDLENLPSDFHFICSYHTLATIEMEFRWIMYEGEDRMTPDELAEKLEIAKQTVLDRWYANEE